MSSAEILADPTSVVSRLSSHQRVLVGIILFGCFVIGAWFAGRSLLTTNSLVPPKTIDVEVRPLSVNVMTVSYVDSITQSRTYTGTVRAKKRSELGFEMTGKLGQVFVEVGDTVAEGTPLAKLDVETLSAQRNAMLASLAQAESLLNELEAGPRQETIEVARAAQVAARSQLEMAQANHDRRKSLFEQGAISREEFDAARFGRQTAAANLQSATQQLAELESGTRQEQVDAQSSRRKQLQASLAEIDVAISKSTLLAPFPGTITERYLDPGSVASALTPVVRLVADRDLECWIGLPVSVVAELSMGDQREITVDGKPYAATVEAKIKELDSQTRTQTVVLNFKALASQAIVSGQLCELKVDSRTETAGFWVPNSALTKGVRGLWSVMALVPDSLESVNSEISAEAAATYRIEKRDIEVLHTESNRVLVRGTLESGNQIAVDGVHRVANGQSVVPVEK